METSRSFVVGWLLAQSEMATDFSPKKQAEFLIQLLLWLRDRVGRNLPYRELKDFILWLGPLVRGQDFVTQYWQWSTSHGGELMSNPWERVCQTRAFGPIKCIDLLGTDGKTRRWALLLGTGTSVPNAILVEATGIRGDRGSIITMSAVKVEITNSDRLKEWFMHAVEQVPNLLHLIVQGLDQQVYQWVEEQEKRLAAARGVLHEVQEADRFLASAWNVATARSSR